MRSSLSDLRRRSGTPESVDYDPAEHSFESLLPGARATTILCVLFLMLLVVL